MFEILKGLKDEYTDKRGNTYKPVCATEKHVFMRGENHRKGSKKCSKCGLHSDTRISRFMVERDPDTGAIKEHLPRVMKYYQDTDAKTWMDKQADQFPENYISEESQARIDTAVEALGLPSSKDELIDQLFKILEECDKEGQL